MSLEINNNELTISTTDISNTKAENEDLKQNLSLLATELEKLRFLFSVSQQIVESDDGLHAKFLSQTHRRVTVDENSDEARQRLEVLLLKLQQ